MFEGVVRLKVGRGSPHAELGAGVFLAHGAVGNDVVSRGAVGAPGVVHSPLFFSGRSFAPSVGEGEPMLGWVTLGAYIA